MKGRWLVLVALALVTLLAVWSGYRVSARKAFIAQGPVPPLPSEPLQFVGRPSSHPFHREAGDVFSRSVFQTSGPSNSRIELRDVMVPPHRRGQLAALPGPALLEVYDGSGSFSVGEEAAEPLAAGNIREVPAGRVLGFDNPGSYPMIVRLYLFEAK